MNLELTKLIYAVLRFDMYVKLLQSSVENMVLELPRIRRQRSSCYRKLCRARHRIHSGSWSCSCHCFGESSRDLSMTGSWRRMAPNVRPLNARSGKVKLKIMHNRWDWHWFIARARAAITHRSSFVDHISHASLYPEFGIVVLSAYYLQLLYRGIALSKSSVEASSP